MDLNLLEHILNTSRRMAEIRSLTPLLNFAIDEAISLVGAEQGFLVLTEPDGSLDFRVKRGQDRRDLDAAEDQISKSVLNQVINAGEPLVLRDALNNPQFNLAQSVVMLKLRSIMCVPLISHGEVIGAIYVENRSITGRFSEDDLPPLILFANQAAVAVENAALNDDLEARVAARTRELERAKLQVEKSWGDAIEANRMRTVWLSNVAHDLRGSLGIVSTTLSVLKMGTFGQLSDVQLGWINKSWTALEHTLTLITNLFDLFKLEAGSITLERELISTEAFLSSIHEVGSALSWPETVTLQLDISPPLPDLFADPVRLRQVLLNLLSNANKFTAEGTVSIHARQLPDEEKILIGVADTGQGIPAEQRERVFERFQQVDDDSYRRQQGSGLGLAICRELVEMHGGKIWVESAPGSGSDFRFTLPLNVDGASDPQPDINKEMLESLG